MASSAKAAQEPEVKAGRVFGGTFQLISKIGSGSFGDVFSATNIKTGEEVAVKFERCEAKRPQLLWESEVYRIMEDAVGIPRYRWSGQESGFNVLVMDILGQDLEVLFNQCSRQFSLKTVLMLADQMIERISFVHSKGFIHRDIKPRNFLMGRGEHSKSVYMVDFGLAKRFRDEETGVHTPYRDNSSLTGTANYISVNTLMGREQSRRDDLESLCYVLLYFLNGSLPWMHLTGRKKNQMYANFIKRRQTISVEELCKGRPPVFTQYFNYCRGLEFEQDPDYNYLRQLFRSLFQEENFVFDHLYDWNILETRQHHSTGDTGNGGGGQNADTTAAN